jgi:hydroxymethylpyrimidine kinase/phosphomethylpyrimidine kinase
VTAARARAVGRGADRLVLTIAGSDPSGGAGLELDLKVLTLHGIHGAAVASCLTLQNARALVAVTPIPWRDGRARIERVRAAAPLGAVKVGMLPGWEWIDGLARLFARGSWPAVVVDPVIAPTNGPAVLSTRDVRRLRERLLPHVDLLTPNALEAAALLGTTPQQVARAPDAAARALLEFGPKSVLLKGGHLLARGDRVVVDRLRGAAGDFDLPLRARSGPSPRGTGCALASAIAARLACGATMAVAVRAAQRWLERARMGARRFGGGRPYLGLVASRAAR